MAAVEHKHQQRRQWRKRSIADRQRLMVEFFSLCFQIETLQRKADRIATQLRQVGRFGEWPEVESK